VTEYTPEHIGTVTKYVFVESPTLTAGELALRAYEVSRGAMIKETCFGLQVSGEPEEVERIIAHVRSFDPCHIFVKDRAFPPGDPRRCRANLGGARPGFHGLEYEFRHLRNVSAGLEELERREEGKLEEEEREPVCIPERPRLGIRRLIELMEAEES